MEQPPRDPPRAADAPAGPRAADSPQAESSRRVHEVVGELARDVSVLLRRELELALVEHLPAARRSLDELLLGVAAAAAALMGFALLSWALVRLLADAMPDWAAGLIVSAAFMALAVALARRSGRPLRRAWARLTDGGGPRGQRRSAAEIVQNRRNARYEAETQVRARAEELVAAAMHEFVEHGEESLEERVEAAEKRSGAVLIEIVKWTVGAPTDLALKALGLRATSQR